MISTAEMINYEPTMEYNRCTIGLITALQLVHCRLTIILSYSVPRNRNGMGSESGSDASSSPVGPNRSPALSPNRNNPGMSIKSIDGIVQCVNARQRWLSLQ